MSQIRGYRSLLFAIFALYGISSGVAHAVTLTRGPYLQNLKSDSVIIVWKTDVNSDSEVSYGMSMSYTDTAYDAASVQQHAVTLTGLASASIYHYQVKGGGQTLTGDLTFHSGKDASFNSFTFVAMGDHRSNPTAHSTVAQRVKSIDPEIIIDTGDLTADGNNISNWDSEFFAPEKDVMSRACLFPSIGNHEGTAANYLSYFYLPSESSGTGRYYSFNYANAHFIMLDTYSSYSSGGLQYSWLVNDLTANQSKKWLIVAFHNPPYSSSTHGSDTNVRSALCPLFTQYGVDVVFNGHDHDYERSYVNGVYYIVTGGGGAPLYPAGFNSWSQFSVSKYHCCRVSINNNSMTLEAIQPDGGVLDTFSFTLTGIGDWMLY
jgi:hypothetical protein